MAARDFQTRLRRRATRAGLALDDELIAGLEAFHALLSRWNEKINLTSLSSTDEAVDRLFLEPLLAVRFLPPGTTRLMDVGSGGGSPAIPMKLAVPALELTMVEAKARKAAFLREAIRQLGLAGTRVETARVEELLPRTDLHESFDLVSIRAVRVEAKVLHTLQAFLVSGGHLFLFRGPSGPTTPAAIFPPLELLTTHSLVESLQSRLTLVRKRPVG